MEQDTFQQAKQAVKRAQALGIFDPILLAKLEIHVTQGWLWLGPVTVPEFCLYPHWILLDSVLRSVTVQKI